MKLQPSGPYSPGGWQTRDDNISTIIQGQHCQHVGNATTVVRFAYKSGDLKAATAPETIVPDLPGYAQLLGGGHWTRAVVLSAYGKHMLVSVGSGLDADDAETHSNEFHRADVLEYMRDGKFIEVYAYCICNCVRLLHL